MPETLNDELRDLSLRHHVQVQRLSSGTIKRLIPLLDQSDAEIVAKLQARSPTLEGSFTSQRLKYLLQAIREINHDAHVELGQELRQELRDLAKYESDFQLRMLQNTTPVSVDYVAPSAELLNAVVTTRPLAGKLLRDSVKGLEDGKYQLLKQAIQLGMIQGETTDQIVRRIRGTRAMGYRDGILNRPRTAAERLVRTATNHVANAARDEVYKENADLIKGVQWVATLDTRTCIQCAGLDGQVFKLGRGPRPPAHLNCFPGDAIVTTSARISAVSKRWFDGQMVIIRTAAGRELACTPNHPVLTTRGWKPAQALDLASQIVCDLRSEAPRAAQGHDQNVPASIHDIASAFLKSSGVQAVPVPVSAEHFHGDAARGQIAIVGTDRFLWDRLNASVGQHSLQRSIVGGLSVDACLICGGPRDLGLEALLASADSIVRSFGAAATLLGRRLAHELVHRIAATASLYGAFREDTLDGTTRDAESVCDRLLAGASDVTLDDVVFVERRKFSGHVYNLETENHLIMVGGIVTHNCRCSTAPVTKTWREMGIDIDEMTPGTRASMNGQVSATETYNSWLKKQSAAVQDEALGPERGKLFRAGDLDVDRFTDARGNALTLDQLRKAEGGQPVLRKSSASDLYEAPKKTADQLIAQHGAADGIRDVNARLAAAARTDLPVSQGGFKLPNGDYTAERAALHKKIVDDLFPPEKVARATPRAGEQPTLTVLGGRGGSGKSWLTGKDGPVDASRAVLLDSDHIKSQLPGYKGWNAALYHEESTDILKMADKRATQLGVNTIHDATLKSTGTVSERIAMYEGSNYKMEGYYMYLSPDAAAERALERFSKGGTFTGRYVPPEVVLGNTENEANFDALSSRFVRWSVFDNSGAKGTAPRLVQSGGSI